MCEANEQDIEEELDSMIAKSPCWMRNLWRGSNITVDHLKKIGTHGKRRYMHCWRWFGPRPVGIICMKALRAESTHVLASVALICRLERYAKCSQTTIPVFTDCITLINRVLTENINNPSLVLTDHIDLIHQIRKLLLTSNIKFNMTHSRTIKNDDFDLASWDEKLIQTIHVKTYGYFKTKTAILPRQYSDILPGGEIMIVTNEKPLVSDVGMAMQMLERREVRNEYFERRMDIEPNMLMNIDTYTLGRVMTKTPYRHVMYSKIIHKQLNTMGVNERWSGASDKCPVCLKDREDWMHPLVCQSPDMIRVGDKILSDFEADMEFFKTYPPLSDYIMAYFRNLHMDTIPPPPGLVDQQHMVEFYNAYDNQCNIGWNNFCRGIVSKNWRFLQHCHLIKSKSSDVHAVDKWTRMFIKSILELNRKLWKERCEILHKENEFTYEQRQRDGIWKFCVYLRKNIHLVPRTDRHFLFHPHSYFYRNSLTSALNWEARMRLSLVPSAEKGSHDIRSFFVEIVDPQREANKRAVDEIIVTENKDRNKKMRQTYLNAATWAGDGMTECEDGVMDEVGETMKRGCTSHDVENKDHKKRRKIEDMASYTHVQCAVEKNVRFKRRCQSPSPDVPHTNTPVQTLTRQLGKKQKINYTSKNDFHLVGPAFWDLYLLT